VIGRPIPTPRDPVPKISKMRLYAPNELVAKSRFWFFMRALRNFKKANGEILSCNRVFEKKPLTIKNYGVWLRYDSRSGTHNMYKEYRDLSRAAAISACYQDMAARHRARFASIHIIKIATLVGKSNVRRAPTKQFMNSSLKFPLPHRRLRAATPGAKRVFLAKRPSTHFG